ncbi:hypothetical protein CUMW_008630 [Citrus unshiu]|nr:hypothetical protein CUMW_008630 [Citrus unshiu]
MEFMLQAFPLPLKLAMEVLNVLPFPPINGTKSSRITFYSKMAQSLQRIWSHGRTVRDTVCPFSRAFSADALVEVKPGEIGMVSGIPEEHLRRRVVIYTPARTATQQGSGKIGRWKINFMSTQK